MSLSADAFPTQPFVKLRHTDPDGTHITTTFTGASQSPELTVPGNAILAGIASVDPARAELILQRMRELIAHNEAVMAWLSADPAHATLFAQDPVTAIRQAIPDLPADFFEGWGTFPKAAG